MRRSVVQVVVVVVVVVVSHIQRIGCQPEKTTLHGGQSRSWSAEQGKENKRKSLAAYPPPPTPHTARSEKINKITRRIYRRYAGGRSRVRTRIPSARRLGLWVWLRKICAGINSSLVEGFGTEGRISVGLRGFSE